MATQLKTTPDLAEALAGIVGEAHVMTGEADREFFGSDVYRMLEMPAVVVRPGSCDELQAVVAAAYAAGAPVVMRGGGASYTDGFLQKLPGGITIDSGRLKGIEVDAENGVVTVEAGVTWAELAETLKPLGLRASFQGPFSGLAATVAGSVSQNSISHGPGVSAEALLNIEIITGTGERLATGSMGSEVGKPFFRWFGPDMAGLFTGDCGALGVKSRLTLRLERRLEPFDAASFSFDSFEAMHAAMRAIAQEGLDQENFGIDAVLQQGQIGRNDSVSAKAEVAKGVMKNASSLGAGVKALAKMAVQGDKALKAATYAVHYITEGVDEAAARAKTAVIRKLALAHGTELPNAVPVVVRGMPYAPLTNVLGPKGERWLPMHAVLAHDAAVPFHHAIRAYWDSQADVMEKHGIFSGTMFMCVGNSGFIYEPTFYWPDTRTLYHDKVVPADHLKTLPHYGAAPEARAEVKRMKADIQALMHAHGAAHLQVGKSYDLLGGRNEASVALLRAIKAALDPKGILNPGALGL
ncbi:MAG: FAD-binding oxidoreductase [Polymorphobacter sp.]|uniref:FAD-binding oxidoreductase n=1 Tax=Polymorphobacter sp. TaxID=1909290 RepID=UPI003A8C471B